MTIVSSLSSLAEIPPGWFPSASSFATSVGWSGGGDEEALFRAQPALRTVISFLARNIASLPLKVYRRISDTDRVRVTDTPLARLLGRPNPSLTRYAWVYGLVADLALYDATFSIKVASPEGRMALIPIPPPWVGVWEGLAMPKSFDLQLAPGITRRGVTPDQVVYIHGYGPTRRSKGVSPLESLAGLLEEERQATGYRQQYWRQAARISGVIERSATAPKWTAEQRDRFVAGFQATYTGDSPTAGRSPVLEDGMTYRPLAFSAVDSQLVESRKLSRVEVAAAYHVPPPSVGVLDNANYSNMTAAHLQLYQDTLGPWLEQLGQELELQLSPDFPELLAGTYLEFDIAGKLRGSFLEQAQAFSTAIGRPWMTAAEGRALQNMPDAGGDSHELVTPLNVLVGGQASPRDTGAQNLNPGATGSPPALPKERSAAGTESQPRGLTKAAVPATAVEPGLVDVARLELRAQHRLKWFQVLGAFFARQRQAVVSKLGAQKRRGTKAVSLAELWDGPRWDAELQADLLRLSTATASVWANETASALGAELDQERLGPWLREHARRAAEGINARTEEGLTAALAADDLSAAVAEVFDWSEGARAEQIAQSQVTAAANFGMHSAAEQAGVRTKRWKVNSAHPRPAHAAVAGTEIELREPFVVMGRSGRWPGDPALGADNNAGCTCTVEFGVAQPRAAPAPGEGLPPAPARAPKPAQPLLTEAQAHARRLLRQTIPMSQELEPAERLDSTLRSLADRTRVTGTETGVLTHLGTGLEVGARAEGTVDAISGQALDDQLALVDAADPAGYAYSHTHPSSNPLSEEDAAVLLATANLRVLFAEGLDGARYALVKNDPTAPARDWPEALRAVRGGYGVWRQRLQLKYQSAFTALMRERGISPTDKAGVARVGTEVSKQHLDEAWRRSADVLGVRYERLASGPLTELPGIGPPPGMGA